MQLGSFVCSICKQLFEDVHVVCSTPSGYLCHSYCQYQCPDKCIKIMFEFNAAASEKFNNLQENKIADLEKQLENLKTVNIWLQEQITAFKEEIKVLKLQTNSNHGAELQEQLLNLNQQMENLRNELISKNSPFVLHESMLPPLNELQTKPLLHSSQSRTFFPKTTNLFDELNTLFCAYKQENNISTRKLKILQNCIEEFGKLQEAEYDNETKKGKDDKEKRCVSIIYYPEKNLCEPLVPVVVGLCKLMSLDGITERDIKAVQSYKSKWTNDVKLNIEFRTQQLRDSFYDQRNKLRNFKTFLCSSLLEIVDNMSNNTYDICNYAIRVLEIPLTYENNKLFLYNEITSRKQIFDMGMKIYRNTFLNDSFE